MIQARPLRNFLLVDRDKPAVLNEAGLHIPKEAQVLPDTGKVVDVGPEVTTVKVGDRVLFTEYGGFEVRIQDVSFLVLKEAEIILRFEEVANVQEK